MESDDWQDRLRAEFWQTKIRYQRLHNAVIKPEAGTLTESSPGEPEQFTAQKRAMGSYLHRPEVRAEARGVDLRKGVD